MCTVTYLSITGIAFAGSEISMVFQDLLDGHVQWEAIVSAFNL